MTTYVLVHGAWHGAWCWRRVARLLTCKGHEIFTPTLTGVGERSHLLSPEINLETQILDVVNVMKWQQLNDVVLVGHSYGGMVISGVAEKLEKSISSFVMLDAFFPENGQAMVDLAVPRVREAILSAQRNGDSTIQPISAATFQVNEKDRSWVDAQCTPHPINCFLQSLTLTGAREHIPNHIYIRATGYANPGFDVQMAKARDRGWKTYEVPCGHDVMLDMPERLCGILQEVAS